MNENKRGYVKRVTWPYSCDTKIAMPYTQEFKIHTSIYTRRETNVQDSVVQIHENIYKKRNKYSRLHYTYLLDPIQSTYSKW